MNNAMQIALMRISRDIPRQILDLAFQNNTRRGYVQSNVDDLIVDSVIKPTVMTDINLIGGKTIQIPLLVEYWERTTPNTRGNVEGQFALYRIPPEARSNQPITEVHYIQHNGTSGFHAGGQYGGSALCQGAKDIMEGHVGSHLPKTPIPEVFQGDLIRLNPAPFNHTDWILTCRIAYDENMTNLNSAAIESFANLCVLATKMYIYNTLIVQLDQAYIQSGSEVASIKNIVDNWSDLTDQYNEERTRYFGMNAMDIQRAAAIYKFGI